MHLRTCYPTRYGCPQNRPEIPTAGKPRIPCNLWGIVRVALSLPILGAHDSMGVLRAPVSNESYVKASQSGERVVVDALK